MKIPLTVIYFLPDSKKNKISDIFQNVFVKYYWENFYINHHIFKYVSYYLYLWHLKRRLKRGDVVYIYGSNDIAHFILKKKGIKVFLEQTECPEVSMSVSRLYHPTLAQHFELCKKLDGLVVISNQLKTYYHLHGIKKERIHIVNMTVDKARFENLHKNTDINRYIVYCGTVSNNKDGVNYLIEAFASVVKIYSDIRLYIIGNSPSPLDSSENIRLIEKLGIKDSVVFTGRLSSEQIPQILKNAHILALARPDNIQSKYGFPTKLGEYLLSENPVVVTDVGDISIYLKNKVNSIVVPPNNSALFAEGLLWVLDNPEKSIILGKKGKELALTSFNAEVESKKLLNILRGYND